MEFKQQHAIFLQIANHLCEEVLCGQLKPGDKIPSIREKAVAIEVNPNTISRAYSHLEQLGIIDKARGVGYYISDHAPAIIKKATREKFLSEELPEFFKTIKLLNISLEEIQALYQQQSREKQP